MNTTLTTKLSTDVDINTAIAMVRQKFAADEAAAKAPLASENIPAHVQREIANVIGTVSTVEVRYHASGIIDARDVVLEDGTVVHVNDKSYDVYSVVVPSLTLKRGYKLYIKTEQDLDGRNQFPFSYLGAVPAMWRRVLALPNSRSQYGGLGAWMTQFRKQSWTNNGRNHVRCINSVADLEQYVR
jgi:hypothetical protein